MFPTARIGVADVKVIFQSPFIWILTVNHGDSGCTPVDPSAKLRIPFFKFQHGGRFGALDENLNLFLKGQLVVSPRRKQKCLPFTGLCGHLFHIMLIHRRDKLKFSRHWRTPPF
ncbi:MAG: hypothetical protein LBQ48_06430 [Oscillospiraceae bacterium]|nr:hypothetical protein [Oscillospiraceae bacterium]